MTALILVVDDQERNVLLLEAKLSNEFYDVITATSAFEALQKVKDRNPDLIVLDIMMPGMDGFSVCRRLKSDPATAHIPVIMVTALSSHSDRLRGLEAGADDFLTKPINDIVFFSRTKSLIRMKMLLDELRRREESAARIEGKPAAVSQFMANVTGSRILVVDDDAEELHKITYHITELHEVETATTYEEAIAKSTQGQFDCILVSAQFRSLEGLRLVSQLKMSESTRHTPQIVMVSPERTQAMLKALELGINDYLLLPIEYNEMMARIRTQIRRKKYQETLLNSYKRQENRPIMDAKTNLYNGQFLHTHLATLTEQANRFGKPVTLIRVEIDRFEELRQQYGSAVDDEILLDLSRILVRSIRTADMAAWAQEEGFSVVLPETDVLSASVVTDRIRKMVESTPFRIHANGQLQELKVTVSISAAQLTRGEPAPQFFQRVDNAVRQIRQTGENQVSLLPRQ